MLRGWRGLGLFWACIIGLVGVGVGTLLLLGAPGSRSVAANGRGDAVASGAAVSRVGSPVAAPDPLLLEAAPDFTGMNLPKVGPGGRRPGQYYAAFSNAADPQAKIALIVAGIGLDRGDSMDAIRELPPAVSLAVSAYADSPDTVLQAARAAGHEYLLSLPMEPAGYPADDEGDHQLLTTATPPENARNLEWALSRITGYAGVTGASDGQRGERFAASPALMGPLGDQLSLRGLFYIDPRTQAEAADQAFGRCIDLVIDEPDGADDIDSKLAQLEQAARLHGSAIGLAGRPSPVVVARINAWVGRLAGDGISLIPVSALMQPTAHAGP